MESLQSHRRTSNAGVTLMELAAIMVLIAIIILLLLPWSRWSEAKMRRVCAGNLKQMGRIYSMYASESPGNRYPPKSPYSSSPDIAVLYPDYMYDLQPLICPELDGLEFHTRSNPDKWSDGAGAPRIETVRREADGSYAYFGFAVPNNAWLGPGASARPLLEHAFENRDDDADWQFHPHPDVKDVKLYRIHPGVEHILATEGHIAAKGPGNESRLAVMWDNLSTTLDPAIKKAGVGTGMPVLNHAPGGSNVLFLDGHVEFVEYGSGRFPVTEEYASISYGGFRSASANDQP